MKTQSTPPIKSSEITPEALYLNRREFIRLAGLAGTAALLAACAPGAPSAPAVTQASQGASASTAQPNTGYKDETGAAANTLQDITHYNNYYEFTVEKEGVADLSQKFPTSPWQVEVGGLVQKKASYSIEDLLKKFPVEERVYRHRCVEGWSMVIPWQGFPLASLLKEADPMTSAKYVAFQTINDPKDMPGMAVPFYPWPYTEGLRLDEAMNNLALLVTGLYGKSLPPQNGAPLRLAVPWKYGFKSIKAIVKIDLVETAPATMWSTISPEEYGFYANVNPNVPHPRWSQSTERRIGEFARRDTLIFNGYADQVASMYNGMDLKANY
jgi:methionine sulfoxide reductase catalytic subunit